MIEISKRVTPLSKWWQNYEGLLIPWKKINPSEFRSPVKGSLFHPPLILI